MGGRVTPQYENATSDWNKIMVWFFVILKIYRFGDVKVVANIGIKKQYADYNTQNNNFSTIFFWYYYKTFWMKMNNTL